MVSKKANQMIEKIVLVGDKLGSVNALCRKKEHVYYVMVPGICTLTTNTHNNAFSYKFIVPS